MPTSTFTSSNKLTGRRDGDRKVSGGSIEGGIISLSTNKELAMCVEGDSLWGRNIAISSAQEGLSKGGFSMCLEFSGKNFHYKVQFIRISLMVILWVHFGS